MSVVDGPAADPPSFDTVTRAPSRIVPLDGGAVRAEERAVAVEVPVQVILADVPFAVMMLTPADLLDFAYGFGLTEGLVDHADEIRDVRVEKRDDGIALRIGLSGERLRRHLSRQRAMTGRTGCGVCGIDDVAALRRAKGAAGEDGIPAMRPAAEPIARALRALDGRQSLNAATRAVHAAAWADRTGALIAVREDVGRHNALDKLIGALVRAGIEPASGFVVITSRCSFEMVEKAATFGARLVVAISAPTSFAIERARQLDVTLCAVARSDSFAIFTGFDGGGEGAADAAEASLTAT